MDILKNGGQKILSLFFVHLVGPILPTALRSIFSTKRFFLFNLVLYCISIVLYIVLYLVLFFLYKLSSFVLLFCRPIV